MPFLLSPAYCGQNSRHLEVCIKSSFGFSVSSPLDVATDDPDEVRVHQHLNDLKIAENIESIYTYADMIPVEGKYKRGKDLARICSEHKIPKESAVFIGDGDRDRIDALRERIRFIHVPPYNLETEEFTFDMIDLTLMLLPKMCFMNLKAS